MPKKPTTLTGVYSELGYVIKKNGKPVYASGNSLFDSQGYFEAKDEDAVDIETVMKYCTATLSQMVTAPELYPNILGKDVRQEPCLVDGGVKYSKSLNPRKIAATTGDLPY